MNPEENIIKFDVEKTVQYWLDGAENDTWIPLIYEIRKNGLELKVAQYLAH